MFICTKYGPDESTASDDMSENTKMESEMSSLPSTALPPNPVESASGVEPPHSTVPPIANAVEHYFAAIRGIGQTAQIALPHIAKWKISEIEKTQKKIEKLVPEIKKDSDGPKTFTLDSARDFAEFSSTIQQLEELRGQNSPEILAKSLFTQLFAEFDAYIGELLKIIYLKNDKLLKGISREISLSDLLDFEDLNAVKLSMLDKEIETFRRDSYIEQFSTLEKKFNLSLKKFKEWPQFVELSQRRNILTHNGGMVSDQYIVACEREGHPFQSKPKIGESLGVTFQYFVSAARLLSKVGLMLAYTLWSKIFPKESELMHGALNQTLYKCLRQKRWVFVAELEDFVMSSQMRKDVSEIDLRIRIVNTSIGLKFAGKDSDVVRLLESVDWSASYRDFKLAIAVLQERYDEAIEIMKSIGKTGEILVQHSYHTWPLFTKFREHPEFYDAYFNIYGEAFAEKVDTAKGSVEAHAKPPSGGSSVRTEGVVIDGVAHEVLQKARQNRRSSTLRKDGESQRSVATHERASNPSVRGTVRKKAAQRS